MTDKRNEFIWNSWFQQGSNEKRVSQWKFFLRREWGYNVKGYRCVEMMNKKINDYIHHEYVEMMMRALLILMVIHIL